MRKKAEIRQVLTRAELAGMFGVDPKTVHRWEKDGKLTGLTVIRTPGGHRRYYEDEAREFIAGMQR